MGCACTSRRPDPERLAGRGSRSRAPRHTSQVAATWGPEPAVAVPSSVAAPAAPADGGGLSRKLVLVGALAGLGLLAFAGVQRFQPRVVAESASASASVASASVTEAEAAAPAGPSVGELFAICEQEVGASAWTTAIRECEEVRAREAGHPGLDTALAAAYLGKGKQELADGGSPTDAVALFDQALAAKPDDAEAQQQRQWAQTYLDGTAALDAGNWAVASDKLGQVYTMAPNYLARSADGGVKPKLALAWLQRGQTALADGQYGEGQRWCEQVLQLEPDNGDAQSCQSTAIAALQPAAPAESASQPAQQARTQQSQPAQSQPTQQTRPQQSQPGAVPARAAGSTAAIAACPASTTAAVATRG